MYSRWHNINEETASPCILGARDSFTVLLSSRALKACCTRILRCSRQSSIQFYDSTYVALLMINILVCGRTEGPRAMRSRDTACQLHEVRRNLPASRSPLSPVLLGRHCSGQADCRGARGRRPTFAF